MCQARSIGFRVLAIKSDYFQRRRLAIVETSCVYTNAVRIRARGIKRFDTADFTECVVGDARIEAIGREAVRPFGKLEMRLRYDQMYKTRARADRAIACLDFNAARRQRRKPNCTAMT